MAGQVIERHSIASRNISAMRRQLPFSAELILSFGAQHTGTKGIWIEERSMDTNAQKGTRQLKERSKEGLLIAYYIGRVAKWLLSRLKFRPVDMVVLNSGKSSLIKFLKMFQLQSSTKIGCLTLSLKEEVVVDILFSLVKSVARGYTKKCFADTDDCYGCGKSGQKMKNYPLQVNKGKDKRQAQPRDFGLSAPRQNIFLYSSDST
uniref:Uncharacterized protein n=1 Tax=Solanum tuberosum TaxID=4113 RepID=M1DM20_SOLTU